MLQTRTVQPGTLELLKKLMQKLKAVTQRGSKKDFFDIYFLLEQMSVEEMLHLFKGKFKQHEIFHVVKSLAYFADAENYADPIVFDPSVTWNKVKTTIRKTVKKMTTT